ncbi:MAG: HEAT repeat domain-containing protein [Winogradskyella sp.]|uniref:HEAT repeat domain-containing protein n=1 Tax=Winogradskyella sp. TaxID=1883156 RepID=UPI000F3C2465|nr:HEAT repeat domain-containing protein [Winogradskyella sp.]RNC85043.1 MAG: HEAT repeat domain-containing protein [Winogradskyella sp.]
MLGRITFLLIKLRILQPNKKILNGWTRNSDAKKLRFILKYGDYKTRPIAAIALADIDDKSSIPLLLESIDDRIHHVSITALNALEQLDTEKETSKIITRKRFYWTELLTKKANTQKKKRGKANIYKWERSSKKTFDMVKERLKRPIRW